MLIAHTYERAPKRAVTLNQNVTEIMLALGLQDCMVGTAFVALPVAERHRNEARTQARDAARCRTRGGCSRSAARGG